MARFRRDGAKPAAEIARLPIEEVQDGGDGRRPAGVPGGGRGASGVYGPLPTESLPAGPTHSADGEGQAFRRGRGTGPTGDLAAHLRRAIRGPEGEPSCRAAAIAEGAGAPNPEGRCDSRRTASDAG